MTDIKVATQIVAGKTADKQALGTPTDGDLTDGYVPLTSTDLVVDAIDDINEGLKAVNDMQGSRTLEDLTIPVDFTSAVDPSPGIVFQTQAQVDADLATQSAVAYKNPQRVRDALPRHVEHVVQLSCAAAIYRPDVADAGAPAAFDFIGFSFAKGGRIELVGPSPATWTPIVGPLTVLSHVVDSGDPSISFTGTPFAGFDLRGRSVVLPSGQVCVIHDHTDSMLRVETKINPALVNGVDQVFVASPTLIFRNSRTDLVGSAVHDICLAISDEVIVKHATIQGWGAGSAGGSTFGTGFFWRGRYLDESLAHENILVDAGAYYDALAVTGTQQNGFLFNADAKRRIAIKNFSVREAASPNYTLTSIGQMLRGTLSTFGGGTYMRGSKSGLNLSNCVVSMPNAVFDAFGLTTAGSLIDGLIALSNGARWISSHFNGKIPEVRNFAKWTGNAGLAAVHLDRHTDNEIGDGRTMFTNNGMDCVRVEGGRIRPGQLEDGGSNAEYGIVIDGPRCEVRLNAATDDVTGASGDVILEGVGRTHASLPTSTTPLITPQLNFITRD